MDVAWVPGGDAASLLALQLYRDRVDAGTHLDTAIVTIAKPRKNRLDVVITEVDTSPAFTKPFGDLILVSHGNDTGWLQIDLDAAADTSVSYQVLRAILDDTNPARRMGLRLPTDLVTNQPIASQVVLAGCRVGAAPKFVDALKQVLGGRVPVVASKYLHEFHPKTHRERGRKAKPTRLGTFEYLSYGFTTTAFLPMGVDDLIDGLNDYPRNRFSDGSPIPIANWKKWLTGVPLDGKKNVRQGDFPLPLSVPLGRTVAGETELTPARIRNQPDHFPVRLPSDDAANATLEGLKAGLKTLPPFDTTYPFPMWEQYGHATFDLFFDAWNWGTPTLKSKKKGDPKQYFWNGVRNEYTLMIPVTDPVDGGNLLFNFFPPRGTTADPAVIGFSETDPALFYRTP